MLFSLFCTVFFHDTFLPMFRYCHAVATLSSRLPCRLISPAAGCRRCRQFFDAASCLPDTVAAPRVVADMPLPTAACSLIFRFAADYFDVY